MTPTVVIITINYNQTLYTVDCINSILDSDYNNYKLLLVDNGSTVSQIDLLDELMPDDERILLTKIKKNIGYVGGVNHGLREATVFKPDYYIIMNNDTVIHKTSISSLVKCCDKHHKKAIVAGKVYEYDERNRVQSIGTIFTDKRYLREKSPGKGEIDSGQYDFEMEMDMLDDILWLIPARLINEIGFYSDHFYFGGEQADFALRAKKNGYKLIYTPDSKIWHKGGGSFNQNRTNPSKQFVFLATKGSIIYKYRNMKLRYFVISTTKSLFKILIKFIISLNSSRNRIYRTELKGIISSLYYIIKNYKTLRN